MLVLLNHRLEAYATFNAKLPRESRSYLRGTASMSAKAGERARKTGDFVCQQCNKKVHVTANDEIPKCPQCGNDTYEERRNEPSNPST